MHCYENHATTVSSQFSHFCPGNEDNKRQVLHEDQKTQGQRHYAQYESDAETKNRRCQRSWLRCDVAADSAAFIDILEAARFDFLSLYLCAKRTEFSNTPRIVGGQSPILSLLLFLSVARPLSFTVCDFV